MVGGNLIGRDARRPGFLEHVFEHARLHRSAHAGRQQGSPFHESGGFPVAADAGGGGRGL